MRHSLSLEHEKFERLAARTCRTLLETLILAYGDIREDYCVYSEEHSFWINDDPTGLGNNFGDALTGAGKK